MNKILISGTGRCGTGCISKCLTDLNIKCGHEAVYTINGVKDWKKYQADSSWLGFPYFPSFDGIKILIIREPIRCIQSLISCKLFDTKYNQFNRYIRKLGYEPRTSEAIRFYVEVNMILFVNCDIIVDINYLEEVLPNVKKYKYYNHRGGKSNIVEDYTEAIEVYDRITSQRLKTNLIKELECIDDN